MLRSNLHLCTMHMSLSRTVYSRGVRLNFGREPDSNLLIACRPNERSISQFSVFNWDGNKFDVLSKGDSRKSYGDPQERHGMIRTLDIVVGSDMLPRMLYITGTECMLWWFWQHAVKLLNDDAVLVKDILCSVSDRVRKNVSSKKP